MAERAWEYLSPDEKIESLHETVKEAAKRCNAFFAADATDKAAFKKAIEKLEARLDALEKVERTEPGSEGI
jgi:hypothetical protein